MRISRKLAALAAFFVIGAAIAGCGSSISGNSVATVAGNPISLTAFDHWMYVFAKSQAASAAQQGANYPPLISSNPTNFTSCEQEIRNGFPQYRTSPKATLEADCKQVFTQDETQVMNFLIQSYWLQADAHRLGISSSKIEASFNKALKKEFKTTKALNAYLKSLGQTKQDQLFQYRAQTLYTKLVKRLQKKVTPAQIAAYYKAHKSSFGTPESVDLHLVRTKTAAEAQAAYNALKSGASWDTVAKKYAADASARINGGTLAGITKNQEEAAVNKAIFSASVNTLVGPVKGIFGSYVLEVTKITPATQKSLAEETTAIKSLLSTTTQTAASKQALATAQKHWKSKTTCRAHYQTTNCSNYTKPKTTTSTTATPTTATTATTGTSTSSTTSTSTATTASTTTTTK